MRCKAVEAMNWKLDNDEVEVVSFFTLLVCGAEVGHKKDDVRRSPQL